MQQYLQLDEVILVPCGKPVHRGAPEAGTSDRLAMLNLAIEGLTGITVDDRECRQPGPSYMVETLKGISRDYPGSRLCFLIGMDAFIHLDSWYHWRDIFTLAHVILVDRPGSNLDCAPELLEELDRRLIPSPGLLPDAEAGSILQLELTPRAISSSEIRAARRRGETVDALVPVAVADYLETNQLYLNSPDPDDQV